jgi:hypothetical protein
MLEASPIPALVADLWGASDVWFMYEQVFLKEGGEARRTPGIRTPPTWPLPDHTWPSPGSPSTRWRKRTPSSSSAGRTGPLYNGSRFELGDDTAPLHPRASLPRLPDIEADRAAWDLVSWAVEPGDLIVFHPAMLHGGAPTHPGQRRRTLTLRFFGDQSVYDPREGGAGPRVAGFHERMRAGEPFRDPSFLKLAPETTLAG